MLAAVDSATIKMNQKWILVILVFCQVSPAAGADQLVQEGQRVDLTCRLVEKASLVVWFRVLGTGMEFIASFSSTGMLKSPAASFPSPFSRESMHRGILTLKSFSRSRDSGLYSCASLMKGVELKFGEVIRLVGEAVEVEVAVEAPQTTTTAATNQCNNTEKNQQATSHISAGETSPQMFCSPIILGPLAGGCGLLLLLLIITTLYCNQIRTRRCPHHYKRKPRMMAPGKQMMTNRHV